METLTQAPIKGTDMALMSAIQYADEEFIFVKPMCEFFGINYKNQVERLSKDQIIKTQVGKKRHELIFGDKSEHLMVSKAGFLRWVQIINPSIVRPEMRKKFEKFQELSFDFLYGGNIQKDQYINYLKAQWEELGSLRKDYSALGNQIQKKRFHIERVMGMAIGEWRESIASPEVIDMGGNEI
jgi:hypothetical protein